jgi:hypothetical protein
MIQIDAGHAGRTAQAVCTLDQQMRDQGMASFVVFGGVRLSVPAFMMSPEWSVNRAGALDWRRHLMRNIVDEVGEIIAKATDDHTVIGGHHRLAVAASLGRKLFWKDTGEPVKLDPFFKGNSHQNTA